MIIKEIDKDIFDRYSTTHMLGSFYQTSAYGEALSNLGYKNMYVGAYLNDKLVGASLILVKSISINVKYGYAPRGFLTDYFNPTLFNMFSKELRKFFSKKGFAFIKINPIITYNEVFPINNSKNLNTNSIPLFDLLKENNYKKLKDNIYFESMLPKYNPIVNLKKFDYRNLDNKLQKRIDKISNKGMSLVKGDVYNINDFYELIKKKSNLSGDFYKQLYKAFDKKGMIDLYLVEVNYHTYLKNLQTDHNVEGTINEKINKLFQMDPNNKSLYNEKMNSDRKLHDVLIEISEINTKIQNGIFKEIVAGALVIKYNNVVSIFESGYNKEFNRVLPNHFLHYMLINTYKQEGFRFMDLNGITGDFSKDNPYRGLNEFKLGWKPRVYEYIGEFDFIINQTKYSLLWSTKALQKEFDKPNLKTEK